MIKKLKVSQVQELLKLHESGMGYQLIEAEVGIYNQKSKFLVLNSQLLINDTPQIINEVKNVFKTGFRTVLFSASEVELKNIRLVENLSYFHTLSFSASTQKKTGAIHQRFELANGIEVFTRLSAYEDDKRIDTVNNKLLPGSFSTTYADYQYCKNNNLNPVDRYALPNDEPITWAFHIRPLKLDILQRGIVEPANNHKGGGGEAYFKNGTSSNTFINKTLY